MDKVISEIGRLAAEYAEVPMLSRTHGQTASPTTMGKEMAVFAYRLQKQRDAAAAVQMMGKMAGGCLGLCVCVGGGEFGCWGFFGVVFLVAGCRFASSLPSDDATLTDICLDHNPD